MRGASTTDPLAVNGSGPASANSSRRQHDRGSPGEATAGDQPGSLLALLDDDSEDLWAQLDHRTLSYGDNKFEYAYEFEFVRRVLRNVEGLNPTWVDAQRELVLDGHKPVRVDFIVEPPASQVLILEVDGFQKHRRSTSCHPSGTGRTYSETTPCLPLATVSGTSPTATRAE